MKNQGLAADLFDGRRYGFVIRCRKYALYNAHLRDLADRSNTGIYESGCCLGVSCFFSGESSLVYAILYRNPCGDGCGRSVLRANSSRCWSYVVGCDKTHSIVMGRVVVSIMSSDSCVCGPMLNGYFRGEGVGFWHRAVAIGKTIKGPAR